MVSMEESDTPALWQALQTAYEQHNPEEARRLLNNGTVPRDCSHIRNCCDTEYLRWLLDNRLIESLPPPAAVSWPELQEKQLQCSILPEAERPACILEGEWEKTPSI